MLFGVDMGCRKTLFVWIRYIVNVSKNIGLTGCSLKVKTYWEVVPKEPSKSSYNFCFI